MTSLSPPTNEAASARFLSGASKKMDSLQVILRNVKASARDLEMAERKILGLQDHLRIEEANDRLASKELKELQRLVKKMAPIIGQLKKLRETYVTSEIRLDNEEKAEAQNLADRIAAADREYEKVLVFLSRYL